VTRRNLKGVAPVLSAEVKQQLASTLEAVKKNVETIYRGTERLPILSVRSPGQAKLTAHTCRLVRTCCRQRNLETTRPAAVLVRRGSVGGYLMLEPLVKFDPNAPDQYALAWHSTKSEAYVDLLPVLQPRNLEVAAGSVMEVPVSLEDLAGKPYLVLHLAVATTRAVTKMSREDPAEVDEESEGDDEAEAE